jgi:hypothetical protein
MRGPLTVLTAMVATVVLAVTPASANHPNSVCDEQSGGYSNNIKIYLQFHWINWSDWWSAYGNHVAIREDTAMNETFRELHAPGPLYQVVTYDGLDHALRTGIQRAGYDFDMYGMTEYSHNYC